MSVCVWNCRCFWLSLLVFFVLFLVNFSVFFNAWKRKRYKKNKTNDYLIECAAKKYILLYNQIIGGSINSIYILYWRYKLWQIVSPRGDSPHRWKSVKKGKNEMNWINFFFFSTFKFQSSKFTGINLMMRIQSYQQIVIISNDSLIWFNSYKCHECQQ